jgi:hypothetical protein
MQTITFETDVNQDGALNICIPSGLPPGKVEVVLVIQPKASSDQREVHQQTTELDREKLLNYPASVNGNHQDNATQAEKGKRMMALLATALEGVEWQEIEEGRVDDANRC